jgi:hypothetical protein
MQTSITYRVIPISAAFLQRTRQTERDDQDQGIERVIAIGGEPCRDTLRRAIAGEELILASYSPFAVAGPYKEFGPVFISANQNELPIDALNLSDLVAQQYLGAQFVLRAYSAQERIVDARLTSPDQCESDLQALLNLDEVQFVLVRFAAYGCYACRLERRH